ncbi:hypothetical protein CAC42_6580 [Sphaceloma murrayae]|uniref:Wbp11/ELF5/Saf1 N-terminal domain-containing protein n=1 Tax=Sphaceloma murrayae TaxID=2082308 RepID=A0A2K1QFV7_9PEZI|nr:hypothetical protein CAC42_6580 [Sphaceloma murrayae]
MAKEKSLNPVAAHAKAEKRAALKKSKATVAKQRDERLSKRNPSRLEKQIAELKDLEKQGGLRPKDQETLKGLERDLGLVKRARERAGVEERPPRDYPEGTRPRGQEQEERRRGLRGEKRRRDDRDRDEGSDTDPEVRTIPMPRDTPPPVPRRKDEERPRTNGVHRPPPQPPQITYSSAPVLKDLKKEATGAKFAPVQVRRNLERAKGKGALVEEEEAERLERAGYRVGGGGGTGRDRGDGKRDMGDENPGVRRGVQVEEVEDEDL